MMSHMLSIEMVGKSGRGFPHEYEMVPIIS
jgi:hypothetical protein